MVELFLDRDSARCIACICRGQHKDTKSRTLIITWGRNRNQELSSSGTINKTLCNVLEVYIYCIVKYIIMY